LERSERLLIIIPANPAVQAVLIAMEDLLEQVIRHADGIQDRGRSAADIPRQDVFAEDIGIQYLKIMGGFTEGASSRQLEAVLQAFIIMQMARQHPGTGQSQPGIGRQQVSTE
jgi:hypothetical protein